MSTIHWYELGSAALLVAFIVFAFRQGMKVGSKQEGNPPERIDGGSFGS
jgi:hypothetical protein